MHRSRRTNRWVSGYREGQHCNNSISRSVHLANAICIPIAGTLSKGWTSVDVVPPLVEHLVHAQSYTQMTKYFLIYFQLPVVEHLSPHRTGENVRCGYVISRYSPVRRDQLSGNNVSSSTSSFWKLLMCICVVMRRGTGVERGQETRGSDV